MNRQALAHDVRCARKVDIVRGQRARTKTQLLEDNATVSDNERHGERGVRGSAVQACVVQGKMVSEADLQAARAEASAATAAAREHAAEVAQLRAELDKLNRQLEQTCTLRLQPCDGADSQVAPSQSGHD